MQSLSLQSAITLIKNKRYKEAYEVLEEMLKKNPKNPDIYFHLGIVATRLKDYEKAIYYLEKLLELGLGFVDIRRVFLILMYNFAMLGDYNEAIIFAKKALELHPHDITALGALGYLYYKINKVEESIKILEKALSIAPEDPHLMNSLGYILADKDIDLKRAEELVKKALEIDPENPDYHDSLGWIYYKKGNLKLAKKHLKIAYSKKPDSEEIKHHIAKLLDI